MGLYAKFLEKFGKQTVIDKTFETTVYEYTIDHLNGETSHEVACGHKHDNGFLLLKVPDQSTWAQYNVSSYSDEAIKPWGEYRGWNEVGRYEGIQEWDRQAVGTYTITLTVDMRENELVDATGDVQASDDIAYELTLE